MLGNYAKKIQKKLKFKHITNFTKKVQINQFSMLIMIK